MLDEGKPSVLDVKDLKTTFKTRGGAVHAVNNVSFHLKAGRASGRGG